VAKDEKRELERAKAILMERVEKQYQHWMAFIREQRAEWEMLHQEDDDLLGSSVKVEIPRAKLPQALRDEFRAVVRMREQQLMELLSQQARQEGKEPPVPDMVLGQVLELFQHELMGKAHAQGAVILWYEGDFHDYDRSHFLAATSDEDYLTNSFQGDTRKQMIIRLLGVIVLGIVGVLAYLWYFAEDTPPDRAEAQALIGTQRISLWQPASMSLNGLPIQTANMQVAQHPLRVCLPPRTTIVESTAIITSSESIRYYDVVPGTSVSGDMVLLACEEQRVLGTGQLRTVQTHTTLELPEYTMKVWASDTDPARIPGTTMLIEFVLAEAIPGEATLILADGSRHVPSAVLQRDEHIVMQYLVPQGNAQRGALAVPRANALPALAAIDLPTPTNRVQLLQDTVTVEQAQAEIIMRDGQALVSLILSIRATNTLTLLPSDIRATSHNAALNLEWTPPTLEADVSTELSVLLPQPQTPSIELSLANWRARIPLQ
jgi:hypothetical protein